MYRGNKVKAVYRAHLLLRRNLFLFIHVQLARLNVYTDFTFSRAQLKDAPCRRGFFIFLRRYLTLKSLVRFRKCGRRSPSTSHPSLSIPSHIYIHFVALASSAANLHILRQNTICIAGEVLGIAGRRWKGNILDEKKKEIKVSRQGVEEIEDTTHDPEAATASQTRTVQSKCVGRHLGSRHWGWKALQVIQVSIVPHEGTHVFTSTHV